MSNYIYSKAGQVGQVPFTVASVGDDVTIATDTQLTTTSGQYLPTFYYKNLTVNAGATLTTSNPCKGLIIIVSGTLTLNGKISMTARGYGSATLPTTDTVDLFTVGSMRRLGIHEVSFVAAERPLNATFPIGQQVSPVTPAGSNGSSGQTTMSCGGGGGSYYTASYQVSAGGLGYVFSGGSGACGAMPTGEAASWPSTTLVNYGLAGGYVSNSGNRWLGGAGNPGEGGTWNSLTSVGATGTGGLLIVVANTIQGTGQFVSKGSNGGASSGNYSGGAGSGGGIVFVRCITHNSFDYINGIDTSGGLSDKSGNFDGRDGGTGYQSFEVFA